MKNAFGGLLRTRRHYTHSVIHETLVELRAIQKEVHSRIFTVMGGTPCGNGRGARTMIPVEKNLLLASADCVAIDAVSAKMMGFDPMKIDYIRLAHKNGLGVGRIEEMKIVGGKALTDTTSTHSFIAKSENLSRLRKEYGASFCKGQHL